MVKRQADSTQTVEYRPGGSTGFFQAPRGMAEFDPTRPLSDRARLIRVELQDISTRPRKGGGTWEIRIGYVQDKLGLNEKQWRAARQELEAAGYYLAVRLNGDGGQWVWRHVAFEDAKAPEELAAEAAWIRQDWAEQRSEARASVRGAGGRTRPPPGVPAKPGPEAPA